MTRRTFLTLAAVLFAVLGAVLLWYSTRGDRTWHFVAACFIALAALATWEERHRT